MFAKCSRALIKSVFYQPNWPIIMQDSDTTCVPQLTFRPILQDDLLIISGENRPDQSSQTFSSYANYHWFEQYSPNLIDQSSFKMGLVLACVVRILHDDWSIRLGENRPDQS